MLKQFDDSNTTIEDDDDNYETPPPLFFHLTNSYGIMPKLDACATKENTKCSYFLTDALHQEWTVGSRVVDVWCNPPGSLQLKFIERAELQHRKYGMNIIMIVPANCISTDIWTQYIENDNFRMREFHRVKGRPIFLKNGKKTKFSSRNSYNCIVWRKKNEV